MAIVVTMSQFGQMGRFGNQVLQYAYLDMVARRNRAMLELPPWVGNQLFGLVNHCKPRSLPRFIERSMYVDDQHEPVGDEKIVNHDFVGYAQYHTRHLVAERDHIREMFTPVSGVLERLIPAVEKLSVYDRVTGLHIRRGDYGQSIFPIIPLDWYKKHLHKTGAEVLFIATEDDSLVHEFSDWEVLTATSLGASLLTNPMENYNYERHDLQNPGGFAGAMDFYADFYLLGQCHEIVGPSSSFSFAAAMLAGPQHEEYWRASLEAEAFLPIDPWNDYPLLREQVTDYPHIKGISVQNNPYWG